MLNKLRLLIHKWLFNYEFDYVLLREGAKEPMRKYPGDAGFDLVSTEAVNVRPGAKAIIKTGVAMKSKSIPCWLYLMSRSSTLERYGLMVDPAVIDDGFTGELFIKVFNTKYDHVVVPAGVRIGQVIPIPQITGRLKQVKHLNIKEGERGDKGFGSSGT